jgi:tRNA threonylcarbamoyl adenosine modification protein YeaZ
MNVYMCLHTTYSNIEVALATETHRLSHFSLAKEFANTQLIPSINNSLQLNKTKLTDISCIIVNQGPAPYTSLRTIIATANGISFTTKIPLAGIHGLQAFIDEYSDPSHIPTVVLLNAFNKSVYYAIQYDTQHTPDIGYEPIETCIQRIKKQFHSKIRFLGNGTDLYQQELINNFGQQAYIPTPCPSTVSLDQILKNGIKNWETQCNIQQSLEPLYLKKSIG